MRKQIVGPILAMALALAAALAMTVPAQAAPAKASAAPVYKKCKITSPSTYGVCLAFKTFNETLELYLKFHPISGPLQAAYVNTYTTGAQATIDGWVFKQTGHHITDWAAGVNTVYGPNLATDNVVTFPGCDKTVVLSHQKWKVVEAGTNKTLYQAPAKIGPATPYTTVLGPAPGYTVLAIAKGTNIKLAGC